MLDNDKSSWDYSELVELYNKNQFEEVIEKLIPLIISLKILLNFIIF